MSAAVRSWNASLRMISKPALRSSSSSLGLVDAAADADVLAVIQIEQPFLRGPAKRRAVPERGSVQHVPGVQMRVEVQHGQRAVSGSRGA